MRKVFLALFLLFVGLSLVSQSVEIRRTTTPVVIDGVIESTWAMADSAYNFQQFFPFDSSLAVAQSVARLLYDDEFIYVSGVMKNPAGARKYITP